MSSPTADLPGLASEDIQRRRRLLAHWRRHSALIRLLRVLLPALCLLIVVGLAGWAGMNALYGRNGGGKVRSNPEIRMLNPNFEGRTQSGKPFLVQAASAIRDSADSARVTLEHPVFTLGGPEERTVVRALHGVYREDSRMLDLHGAVTLDDYKGNHLLTEHALVDTAKSNVDGETRVIGSGPLGRIDASSYAVRDGGAVAHFAGQVKSRIEHRSAFVAPAPAKLGPAK